jgi:thiosulfate/3-mercaptopyruvate sulfurtransferase
MLPSEKQFTDILKQNNIKMSSRVVLYDSKYGQNHQPARAYWMFTIFGHKNVSILNGGLTKWEKEGRLVISDPDVGTEEDYKVTLNADLLRSYEQICELEPQIANKTTEI